MRILRFLTLFLFGALLSGTVFICCDAKPAYFYALVRNSVWALLAKIRGPVFADENYLLGQILTAFIHGLVFLFLTQVITALADRLKMKSQVAPFIISAGIYVVLLFFAFTINAP